MPSDLTESQQETARSGRRQVTPRGSGHPTRGAGAPDFGFEFAKADGGWKWTAYDALGRVSAAGVAPTRAVAAACVIRELART